MRLYISLSKTKCSVGSVGWIEKWRLKAIFQMKEYQHKQLPPKLQSAPLHTFHLLFWFRYTCTRTQPYSILSLLTTHWRPYFPPIYDNTWGRKSFTLTIYTQIDTSTHTSLLPTDEINAAVTLLLLLLRKADKQNVN